MSAQPDASTEGPFWRRVWPPRRVARLFAVLAPVWVLLDQVTKFIAVRVFADSPMDLGFVRLVDVRNEGAAFGIPGFPGLFLVVTTVVVGLVLRALPRTDRPALGIAYGLVVGGAIGNGLDRIFRSPGFPGGGVVDFIDLGWFPVFNVADAGITVGAALLVLLLTLMEPPPEPEPLEESERQSIRPATQPPRSEGSPWQT